MGWKVLRVATISPWGILLWQRGTWSWLMPLLTHVITVLMLLMIAPCISNCLTHFCLPRSASYNMQCQFNKDIEKLHPTTENITHSQMDTAIRTLRLEISKRGRPNAPHHPSSAGSSQKDLYAPIPKELGLPSLEAVLLGSQNRKKRVQNVSG